MLLYPIASFSIIFLRSSHFFCFALLFLSFPLETVEITPAPAAARAMDRFAMRLFSSKVPVIAGEIVKKLVADEDLEAERPAEVEKDVEAVLNEYLRLEREVTTKTKELMDGRKLPSSDFNRVKKSVAEQKGLKLGDEIIDFLLDQLVESFLYSNSVDEVFSTDVELRRKMAPILKKHMQVEEELDREVRGRLKHLEEGTPVWDIEYGKTLETLKRTKGMK